MSAFTLGVDPGKSGALAILDGTQILDIEDMPDLSGAALGAWMRTLLDDLAPHTIDVAWVEVAASRPRQSSKATWTQAHGHGALLGALGALGVPVELVTAPSWRKTHGITVPVSVPKERKRAEGKRMSRQKACELWPSEAHRFARVKDDGRAEACLVALHGVKAGG